MSHFIIQAHDITRFCPSLRRREGGKKSIRASARSQKRRIKSCSQARCGNTEDKQQSETSCAVGNLNEPNRRGPAVPLDRNMALRMSSRRPPADRCLSAFIAAIALCDQARRDPARHSPPPGLKSTAFRPRNRPRNRKPAGFPPRQSANGRPAAFPSRRCRPAGRLR